MHSSSSTTIVLTYPNNCQFPTNIYNNEQRKEACKEPSLSPSSANEQMQKQCILLEVFYSHTIKLPHPFYDRSWRPRFCRNNTILSTSMTRVSMQQHLVFKQHFFHSINMSLRDELLELLHRHIGITML